jgi:hypothetical protein
MAKRYSHGRLMLPIKKIRKSTGEIGLGQKIMNVVSDEGSLQRTLHYR